MRELGPPPDRVLELRAVRLQPVAAAHRRSDRCSHQHVVHKEQLRSGKLAHRRGVRRDVALTFLGAEVLQQPRLEPRVVVEDEHRQQPAGKLGTTTSALPMS